jgi:formylglycine-generating enzyme required for sulfatase activity
MKKLSLTLLAIVACGLSVFATVKGDVNGDGTVTAADVTAIYDYLLNNDMTHYSTADVNNDGNITAADVTFIYDILLGNVQPDEGVTEYSVGGVKFKMVDVEGGTFNMGATVEQASDAFDDEKPAHQVTLSSFAIGQTEVTQELWQAVMGNNPSSFTGDLQRPVEYVSWNDCQQFITQLNQMTGKNFRLPTEAEWEYVARGGNKSQGYKYAGSHIIDDVAWCYSNANLTTHPVATKAPNELGLYDMSGNVNEWCQDWYGSYSADAQTNPTGPSSGSSRVVRGGSYYNNARGCRVAYRFKLAVTNRVSYLGLRLAM